MTNNGSSYQISISGGCGIGVNNGEIVQKGGNIAGIFNEAQKPNLAKVAAEIQQLLEQLEKSYPADTNDGKRAIATETISQIDRNPILADRILSALKAGGVSAFEQLLSHPAASFVITALEDWQKTKGS